MLTPTERHADNLRTCNLRTPAQEFSAIFSRGSARRFQPYQRSRGRAARSTVFRTKEVVLLPSPMDNETIRGPRKYRLMSQGFIKSEVQMDKSWSGADVIKFFEETFEEKLHLLPSPKVKIMLGVGRCLQEPCLENNAELDGARISRLFNQKIIWLRPSGILNINEDDNQRITDWASTEHEDPTDAEVFESDWSQNEDPTDVFEADWPQNEESNGDNSLLPETVTEKYRERNLDKDSASTLVEIDRNNFFPSALLFYKGAVGDLSSLKKKLRVSFKGEPGIDEGALTREYFTVLLNKATEELFEKCGEEFGFCCIPKQCGGNLQMFKIFGVICAHSILQGGPSFKAFPPWAVDVMFGKEASGLDIKYIPVTSSNGNLLLFIRSLQQAKTTEEINKLFSSEDGPAFEQIIAGSDWDNTVPIDSENKSIIIDILINEELVYRRSKKFAAIANGLKMMGFEEFFPEAQHLFVALKEKLTAERLMVLIDWAKPTEEEEVVQKYMKDFITSSSSEIRVKLLMFITATEDATDLDFNCISLNYLPGEVLCHSSACTNTISLPLSCKDFEEFKSNLSAVLDLGSIGFGDY